MCTFFSYLPLFANSFNYFYNFPRLICTDSLARGIDIERVSCVVLYNVPKYPKNYIHRIGRTARAGHKGKAITFVIPEHVN